MATIIFSANRPSLSVRGPCVESDLHYLLMAIETFGRTCPQLVLDLTRVGLMTRPVAEAMLESCSRLERDGVHIRVCARPCGAVDRMLEAVRGDGTALDQQTAVDREAV